MPLALSATGPNTSIEIVLPVSVSMPMPAHRHAKGDEHRRCAGECTSDSIERKIAAAMTMTAATVLSYPTAKP